jgi:hypothetical protein
LHIPATSAVDWEVALKACVETGGADYGVHGSVLPVRRHDAHGVNVRYWTHNVNIVGCKRLEVPRTRSYTAVRSPIISARRHLVSSLISSACLCRTLRVLHSVRQILCELLQIRLHTSFKRLAIFEI